MDLILLTKFYPFGTGEAFIENEIEILSKFFSKIYIIACEVPKQTKTCRNVPSNVKICKVEKKEKILDIVQSFFSRNLNNHIYREEYNNLRTFQEKTFLRYFEHKCQRIYHEIIKQKYLNDLNDSDKVVIYSYWFFSTARVSELIKQNEKYNIKLAISRAHRYDLYAERNILNYLPYRENLLRNFDFILPCSENGEIYLNNLYPKYIEKIHKSYLGTRDEGVSSFNNDEVLRILSCSRIESVKRLDRLAEALTLVDENINMIKWTHIGMGSEFKKLKKIVRKLPNNVVVEFLGNLSNKDVLDYYRNNSIDVFVNVSESEGLPVSIMEAISFGIPIIATDVGGTSEIVYDNINGYLIPKDFEKESLTRIIENMAKIKNTEKFLNLRNESRNIWERFYQADKNYYEFCRFLKRKVEKDGEIRK